MKKIEQQNYLLGIHPRRRHDEAAPAPQRRRKAGSGGGANAPSVARDEGNEWGGGWTVSQEASGGNGGGPTSPNSQATADARRYRGSRQAWWKVFLSLAVAVAGRRLCVVPT
jgi:hypothetical protein